MSKRISSEGYYETIVKANSKRKYKDVALLFEMLSPYEKKNFISYLKEHPSYQIDKNIQDTCTRCNALIHLQ